jgi:polysaccharide pyruvyl transferase WcaK-like protein
MSKVIWHIGAWRNNIGDRVLQVANSNILKERCKKNLEFVYIDIQQTYFSENLIDKMNNEADLVLIGGGGLVFHRPEDRSRSDWQFNIEKKNIRKIKSPIAIYGIGYNKFPYDNHEFSQKMWEHVQETIDHSDLFSVRNEGTYNVLSEHCNTQKVEIVPDAGMFIRPDSYYHKCLDNDKLKIGVNWATDRPDQRFESKEDASKKMKWFFNALKKEAENLDAQVYLIDHLLREERNYIVKDELHAVAKDILGDRVHILYKETEEELFPPFDYTAGFFADIYRQMDFVTGMRGHATIIPFGQNTPCIGLGSHKKVKWFLEHTGLDHLVVTLDGTTDQINKSLHLAVNDVVKNIDTYKYTMNIRHAELSYIKDAFVDKIIGLL